MIIGEQQITDIENVLKSALRKKFQNYKPEPAAMPFHTRLLGQDRLALFSFIHSLNTSFGTSIFEPVAVALASSRFSKVETQVDVGNQISELALYEIQKIIDNLTAAYVKPNKLNEIEILRNVCQSRKMRKVKLTKVDVALKD